MSKLKYAVHAYAWTTSWSNTTLDLIDHAKALGFDLIEIPLMEIDKVDPVAIKKRLQAVDIGVITSVACSEATDLTGEDEATRKAGVEYLKRCVKASSDMGATSFSGVIYSAIGRKIDARRTLLDTCRSGAENRRPLCARFRRDGWPRTRESLRNILGQHG
jgi:D-psicose/D-tagatose/L-ribulose 3-epimerase